MPSLPTSTPSFSVLLPKSESVTAHYRGHANLLRENGIVTMPGPGVINVPQQRALPRPHQTPPSPRSPLVSERTDDYVGKESHDDVFKVGCVLHVAQGSKQ